LARRSPGGSGQARKHMYLGLSTEKCIRPGTRQTRAGASELGEIRAASVRSPRRRLSVSWLAHRAPRRRTARAAQNPVNDVAAKAAATYGGVAVAPQMPFRWPSRPESSYSLATMTACGSRVAFFLESVGAASRARAGPLAADRRGPARAVSFDRQAGDA
jgi:hypothetical protein